MLFFLDEQVGFGFGGFLPGFGFEGFDFTDVLQSMGNGKGAVGFGGFFYSGGPDGAGGVGPVLVVFG